MFKDNKISLVLGFCLVLLSSKSVEAGNESKPVKKAVKTVSFMHPSENNALETLAAAAGAAQQRVNPVIDELFGAAVNAVIEELIEIEQALFEYCCNESDGFDIELFWQRRAELAGTIAATLFEVFQLHTIIFSSEIKQVVSKKMFKFFCAELNEFDRAHKPGEEILSATATEVRAFLDQRYAFARALPNQFMVGFASIAALLKQG